MTKTEGLSLSDIRNQVATEEAVDFEPYDAKGNPSGIVLKVLSDQSKIVQDRLLALIDRKRRQDQLLAAQAERSRPGEVVASVKDDAEYGRRLVAARLAGWTGIAEDFNDSNAAELLRLIPGFGPQIIRKSEELGGFTVASPTA
ncbi:MAG: hypothetical protein IT546_11140 [Caulobacteraceae bacterium]|nr:hypothetical protein [Caulobacteraceae bacterium]